MSDEENLSPSSGSGSGGTPRTDGGTLEPDIYERPAGFDPKVDYRPFWSPGVAAIRLVIWPASHGMNKFNGVVADANGVVASPEVVAFTAMVRSDQTGDFRAAVRNGAAGTRTANALHYLPAQPNDNESRALSPDGNTIVHRIATFIHAIAPLLTCYAVVISGSDPPDPCRPPPPPPR